MSRLTAPFLGMLVVAVAGAVVVDAVVVEELLDEVEEHPARPIAPILSVIPATRKRGFM
jgi:hypothetical protein